QSQRDSPLVTLYQTPDCPQGPTLSAYCVKLETFLRLTRIPYKKVIADHSQAPLGKVPYIAYKGQVITDSSQIIEWLTHDAQLAPDIDRHLSARLRANSLAYKILVEQELLYLMGWEGWCTPRGWALVEKTLFGSIMFPLRGVIGSHVRKLVQQRYAADALDRTPQSVIVARMEKAVAALAVLVDRHEFALSLEYPTTLDASVYAFLIRALAVPSCPMMAEVVRKHQNLIDYTNRMTTAYFPEY
ncbi:hypothetical protein BJ085DRAFT_7656, partial [Dimargaris cristalligena]